MKKTYLFFILLALFFEAPAQSWQWAKITAADLQNPVFNCMAVDNNGDFFLSTDFNDNNGYPIAASVSKFNAQGTELWRKNIQGSACIREIFFQGNDLFITGFFKSSCQFGNTTVTSAGGEDIFVSCISTSGNFTWTKSYGGPLDEYGNGIYADNSGNVFLTGTYSGNATFGTSSLTCQGSSNMFFAKLNANGTIMLLRSAGCADNSGSSGTRIRTDSSENIFILGRFADIVMDTFHLIGDHYFGSDFLCKLDQNGSALWLEQVLTGTQQFSDMVSDPLGNIITSGEGAWTNGGWIVTHKYDQAGQQLWNSGVTGSCYGDYYQSTSITAGAANSFIIGTASRGNCLPPHFKSLLLAAYDPSGVIVFRDSIDAPGANANGCISGASIRMDANGDYVICGSIVYGEIILGNDTLNEVNTGTFIAKFSVKSPSALETNDQVSEQVHISPNPSHGLFTLSGMGPHSEIKVYNLLGAQVYSGKVEEKQIQIDLSDKPKGIYFVRLLSEKGNSTQKVVIE
jgi:hypothetical protein